MSFWSTLEADINIGFGFAAAVEPEINTFLPEYGPILTIAGSIVSTLEQLLGPIFAPKPVTGALAVKAGLPEVNISSLIQLAAYNNVLQQFTASKGLKKT